MDLKLQLNREATPDNGKHLPDSETASQAASSIDYHEHVTDEESDTEVPEDKGLIRKHIAPLKHRWNFIPCLLFLCYLGAAGWYFKVRVEGVKNAGWYPYQLYVLVLEWIGVSAFLPYAILITRGVYPTGSPGLPPADDSEDLSKPGADPKKQVQGARLHVRVLVPCYKESLEVIQATVTHALQAKLPASVRRTVYLCDDGKSDEKKRYIEGLAEQGLSVEYVSGRVRKTGEINGKSANLNNCLKNVIFADKKDEHGVIDWSEISNKELLVVFDADMCAKSDFFLKILEIMIDDDIALCLTPQAFHNIDPGIDLFNAINVQFWEYWLPGAFAWGYIACTGTNFCLRLRSLAHCGWFPEYTITEDYALGMELKTRGYKATYLMDYIAEGEAPLEIRNVFRQRSRWTKGHYQVFFSRRNSLLNWDLPFFQKLWYAYAAWSPFCTTLTVPGFMIAPLISVVFGIHPVVITYNFVFASTIYFFVQIMIQFYVNRANHLKLMWYVNMSNVVLWFTYTKAFWNSFLAALGLKAVMFKATDKVATILGAVVQNPAKNIPARGGPGEDGVEMRSKMVRDDPSDNVYDHDGVMANPAHGHAAPYDIQCVVNVNSQRPASGAAHTTRYSRSSPGSGEQGDLRSNRHGVSESGGLPVSYNAAVVRDVRYMTAPQLPSDSVYVSELPQAATGQFHAQHTGGSSGGHSDTGSDEAAAGGSRRKDAFIRPTGVPSDLAASGVIMDEHMRASAGYMQPAAAATAGPRMSMPQYGMTDVYGNPMMEPMQSGTPRGRTRSTPGYAMAQEPSFATGMGGYHHSHHRSYDGSVGMSHSYDPVMEHVTFNSMHSGMDQMGNPINPMGSMVPPLSPRSLTPNPYQYDSPFTFNGMAGPGMMPNAYGMGMGMTPEYGLAPPAAALRDPYLPSGMVQPNFDPYTGMPLHGGAVTPRYTSRPASPRDRRIRAGRYSESRSTRDTDLSRYSPSSLGDGSESSRLMKEESSYDQPKKSNRKMRRRMMKGQTSSTNLEQDGRKARGSKEPVQWEGGWTRFKGIMVSLKPTGWDDLGKSFDPLAMFLMWCLNLAIAGLGLWQLILNINTDTVAKFAFDSPLNGNPYLVIAVLWALFNSIPSFMFVLYTISSGKLFRMWTKVLPVFSTLLTITAVVLLWLMIPTDVRFDDALTLSYNNFVPSQVFKGDLTTATNTRFVAGGQTINIQKLLLRGPNDPLYTVNSLNFSTAQLASVPFPDLSGGLMAGPDHTKSVPALAFSMTWMAWSIREFPKGFTAEQLASAKNTLKTGADYLMRCNLNFNNTDNPVFVAQVGDPSDYVVLDVDGYHPDQQGKIWTSPEQDPFLTGQRQRKVWLMTRETPGVDAIADASAALAAAAVTLAYEPGMSDFARRAARHSQYLYAWAKSVVKSVEEQSQRATGDPNDANPPSYCNYAKCNTTVAVQDFVTLKKPTTATGQPLCWWADWTTSTCKPGWNTRFCDKKRGLSSEVFLQMQTCCGYMRSTGIWKGMATRGLGVCGLPVGHTTCFYPDYNVRTCRNQTIDPETGDGCTGVGMEVFDQPGECCNFLNNNGKTDNSGTLQPTGICSRSSFEEGFQCYVPDYKENTCQLRAAAECAQMVDARSYYINPLDCCNFLITYLNTNKLLVGKQGLYRTTGICASTNITIALSGDGGDNPPPPPPPPSTTGAVAAPATFFPTVAAPATPVDLIPGLTAIPGIPTAITPVVAPTPVVVTPTPVVAPTTIPAPVPVPAPAPIVATPGAAAPARGLRETILSGLSGIPQYLPRRLQQAAAPATTTTTTSATTTTSDSLSNSTALLDVNGTWPLATNPRFIMDPCALPGSCLTNQPITRQMDVAFFNSTSVYDNMAWASVWQYWMTSNNAYMGDAELYQSRHYSSDVPPGYLQTNRSAYLTNWNNMAWAVDVALAQSSANSDYINRLKKLFQVWLFGDAVTDALPAPQLPEEIWMGGRNLANYTDPNGNITYSIVPKCMPTKRYEEMCFDGQDDDCNGLVDREDPACGLFPVMYSPGDRSWSAGPSLPHTANTAFLALVLSKNVSTKGASRLRCWALAQAGHMIGTGAGERSYVVGVGPDSPTLIQHRASSCPAPGTGQTCGWSQYILSFANPRLDMVKGALISGPDRFDNLNEKRTSSDMRVTLHENVGFLATLAGLEGTGTRVRSCEQYHGVYQKLLGTASLDW